MEIQAEEAFEFLIQHLAAVPPNITRYSLAALRYAHMYLPDVNRRGVPTPIGELSYWSIER